MELASRIRAQIEDRLLTAPNPFFAPVFPAPDEDAIETACRKVGEVGGIDAGRLVPPELCAEICARLDLAFAGRLPEVKTKQNTRTGIGQVLNPLRLHPAMVELAAQPFLLAVIERYLRRKIYLADVDVRRVPPMTMHELNERAGTVRIGYTSSHWHRDIRGRQVKVMVYFTDVDETDSNFAYIAGSHRGHHCRPLQVETSRLSDQQISALGVSPTECYGAAGTTLLFDTNCAHRLRRKPTARIRDSVTFYYTPGQELRALDVDPVDLARLPDAARALFSGTGRATY